MGGGNTFEEGVRADLTEKFTLEQMLGGGAMLTSEYSGGGKNKCQVPEAGACHGRGGRRGQGGDRGQSEAMVRAETWFWMEKKPLECFKQRVK